MHKRNINNEISGRISTSCWHRKKVKPPYSSKYSYHCNPQTPNVWANVITFHVSRGINPFWLKTKKRTHKHLSLTNLYSSYVHNLFITTFKIGIWEIPFLLWVSWSTCSSQFMAERKNYAKKKPLIFCLLFSNWNILAKGKYQKQNRPKTTKC